MSTKHGSHYWRCVVCLSERWRGNAHDSPLRLWCPRCQAERPFFPVDNRITATSWPPPARQPQEEQA